MATSFAVRKGRKHKMRLMREKEEQMVVKSLSVPPGLEALMEGLTREVLRMQPQDICLFASEHFAKLIKMREAAGDEYQFCKTTIHDKIKQKNVPSRIGVQNLKASPKDEVEMLDDNVPLAVPGLDLGRMTNGTSNDGSETKWNRSEASTAEIDKIQGGFFEPKPGIDTVNAVTNMTELDEVTQPKDDDNTTITEEQIKDVKNTESAEHDMKESKDETEPDKTEDKDNVVTKENEELAGGKENVESNIVEEDKGINEIQVEEIKKDNDVSENIEKDVVTKDSIEIPNEDVKDEEKEETDKEVITAHDGREEEVTSIANGAEENKGNEENLDNVEEKEHLAATDENTLDIKEDKNVAELNKAEKKENGDKEESNEVEKVSEIIPSADQETTLGVEGINGENKTDELKEKSDSNLENIVELKGESPLKKSQDSEMENLADLKKEGTDNKLETTDEQDELSDSNDVVTQEVETEIPSVEKVQSPLDENTGNSSSLEDKDLSANETKVEDSSETKVLDENLENVQNKSMENESHTVLEKDIINNKDTEKELDSQGRDAIHTDGVTQVNSSMEKDTRPEEHDVQKLAIPEISTTVATPTPSEDGSTSADNIPKELEDLTTDGKFTEEEIKAATKLQSLWRGYSLRKIRNAGTVDNEQMNGEKSDDLHKLTTAATVIQSLWRGYNVRKANNLKSVADIEPGNEETPTVDTANIPDEQNIAATKIQSSWRGYNVRKKRHIDKNNMEKDTEPENTSKDDIPTVDTANIPAEQNIAATKIQSSWRDYNVRKKRHIDLNETENASDEEQNKTHRDEKSVEQGDKPEEEEIAKEIMAATVIQALWRGYIIRKSRNLGRANESKNDADAINIGKLNLAAAKIQSLWRGYNYRKVQNLSTAVAENEIPIKENLSEKIEHKDEDLTKATAVDSQLETENKTDTTVVESDKDEKIESELQAEKAPVVETEKTTEKGLENAVQPSDTEVNAKQETEAVEPEIEAEKTTKVESGNTAEHTDSEANIAEVIALTKSDTDDEKTAKASEHIAGDDGISKTDADTHDENEIVESEKTSEENTEATIHTDEPESEIKSEEVAEKAESIDNENEAKSEEKSEKVTENHEPIVKIKEINKTDETEGEVKSQQVAETVESVVKTEEIDKIDKAENEDKTKDAETVEPVVKSDEAEGKSEELAEKAEPVVKTEENNKTDEAKDEVKSEVAEKPVVKEEQIVETAEPEVKSEEVAENPESVIKAEDIVKTDETDDEVKSEEVTETVDPVVKSDEAEGKLEDLAEKAEPVVKTEDIDKANETEDEAISEVTEKVEPAGKEEDIKIARGEVKSKEVAEIAEPVVKKEEIVTTDEAKVDEKLKEKHEPVASAKEEIVKTDEEKEDEKSEEVAEKHEAVVSAKEEIDKTDEDEGHKKSEEVAETAEPVVKTDECEVNSEKVAETAEPIVKAEETVEATETEDESKTEEISKRAEIENGVKSEDITESAELTEDAESDIKSKDVTETTENDVKPEEINEPEIKDKQIADKVEPPVADEETPETVESSVSDKETPEMNNSLVTADSVAVNPEEDTDIVKPEEFSETSEPETKVEDTAVTNETDKTVDSEIDAERSEELHEAGSTPVSENITQELAEKVEGSLTQTENDKDPLEKTELQSDKKVDSSNGEIKEIEKTNVIDEKETGNTDLDESKTVSESEKHSETNDVENEKLAETSTIVPGSESNTSDTENVEAKNVNGSDKIEADDNVDIKPDSSDISAESPEHTTITTPSEEVVEEHATTSPGVQETSLKDTASKTESKQETVPALQSKEEDKTESETALSKDADENEETASRVGNDEELKEPSTLISEDSTGENLTKLKSTDVKDDENLESLDGKVNEKTDKDANNALDTTEIQDSKNTEVDENKEIDIHENVTLSSHPADETEVGDDQIKQPDKKKESVETVDASPETNIDSSPLNKEDISNEMEISNTITLHHSSEEQKLQSAETNDSIADTKDANQSEESSNEINSETAPEHDNKSLDKEQSPVQTDTAHTDTPTEVQSSETANAGTSEVDLKDNANQDILESTEQDESKKNDAATKIQSTWRGYNVRKSNITNVKNPETKLENEPEENVEKSKDEISKQTVDTAEKTREDLETPEKSGDESTNKDGTESTVDKGTDESKEEGTKIIEPIVEQMEHSTENSEMTKEVETTEINNGKTFGDSSKTDEHQSETTVTNEAVPINTEDDNKQDKREISENKEDISSTGPTDKIEQEEVSDKLEESSPNNTDKVPENLEESKKVQDDLEHVPSTLDNVEPNILKSETTNLETDTKLKEETDTSSEITDTADSRADDHKETYQESEASTVDIRDVEDCLKSPVHTGEGNDLELSIHEDGEKLNDSSDTKNLLDTENRVKFYVGPNESNEIQIVDKETEKHDDKTAENSDKLPIDEATDENYSKMHKSVTSVLLSTLNDDAEELEKGKPSKETSDHDTCIVAGENKDKKDNDEEETVQDTVENSDVTATNHSLDGKDTTQADEEHQDNDSNIIANSNEPNEDAKTENINEPEENQDQHTTDKTLENNNATSHENMSTDESEKLHDNKDKEKLAINIENFDKALLENEEEKQVTHHIHADVDNVTDESVTHKDDTEDTPALVTKAETVSAIPARLENTDELNKTIDTVVDSNTANESTSHSDRIVDDQHMVNSENKSDSVQNKDLSPRNLHEDSTSVSETNSSKTIEPTQDTAESTGISELQSDKKVDSSSAEVKEIENTNSEHNIKENTLLDESKTVSESEKHSETNDVDKENLAEASVIVPERENSTLNTENVETESADSSYKIEASDKVDINPDNSEISAGSREHTSITTPSEEVEEHATTSAGVQEILLKDSASSVSKEEIIPALQNEVKQHENIESDATPTHTLANTADTDIHTSHKPVSISSQANNAECTQGEDKDEHHGEEIHEAPHTPVSATTEDTHTEIPHESEDKSPSLVNDEDKHSVDEVDNDVKNVESDEITQTPVATTAGDMLRESGSKSPTSVYDENHSVSEVKNIELEDTHTPAVNNKNEEVNDATPIEAQSSAEENKSTLTGEETKDDGTKITNAEKLETITETTNANENGNDKMKQTDIKDTDNEKQNVEKLENTEDTSSSNESKSFISDNDENHGESGVKNTELQDTHTPVLTNTEDSQTKLSKEKDSGTNIEENEPEKFDETTIISTAEDKDNEQMEHSTDNLNDTKNTEENKLDSSEETSGDSKNSDEELAHHDKENLITDTTEDKNKEENIHIDSTFELKQNEENNLDINDMKEENKIDEIMIKHIESQIEPDITDGSETKNNQATVLEGTTTTAEQHEVALEKEGNSNVTKHNQGTVLEDTTTNDEQHKATLEKEGNSDVNSPEDNGKTIDNITEKDKAAVIIQSTWKGYNLRRTLHEDNELGNLQRPAECDELQGQTNVAEDADRISQAATTIQAGARGYLVRKRRHLAKPTEVPSENADGVTIDKSDSASVASQVTVIEKQANTLDTSQSLGSMDNIKDEDEEENDPTPKEIQSSAEESTSTITKDAETNITNKLDNSQSLSSIENTTPEDEEKDDATPKETQSSAEENKSTLTSEETKDDETKITNAEKLETITETTNTNANGNDKMKETDNEKQNVEKLESSEDTSSSNENKSVEEHSNKEETTNIEDEKELDEIDALNLRLRNLNRTNVYQIEEEKEPDDKVEDHNVKADSPKAVKINFDRALSDLHAQASKSSDDDASVIIAPSVTEISKPADSHKELQTEDKHSHGEPHTEAENKEVAHILEEPKPSTTPRLSVNLDDFDSSRYDLKVDHATARSKNTSPVHELTSAAYKIGAAIATDDETIVDAMDDSAKDKKEDKPVEYIHIPLQGPLPERVEEKPIEKETLKASQQHGISTGETEDDGESPEYIYIPLKEPGAVDKEEEEKSTTEANVESMKDLEYVDNQKEDMKKEDTIPQSVTENKEDNEDKIKEDVLISEQQKHLETEPAEQKQDMADEPNDKARELEDKEENEVQREKHDASEKEHVEAEKLAESATNNVREKESDNETDQISEIPESMDKTSEALSSGAKSTELKLSESKSQELIHSAKLADKISEGDIENSVESVEIEAKSSEPGLLEGKSSEHQVAETKPSELKLAESKHTESVVSAEPVEKLTKGNIEQSAASEIRENYSPELVLPGNKTPEPILTETKSAESELSQSKSPDEQPTEEITPKEDTNKSSEPVLSETKTPGQELSQNKTPGPLISKTEAPEELLSTNKSPEPVTKTAEPEISENKLSESVASENKTPEYKLSGNKSPELLSTETKASEELLSTNKSPQPEHTEKVVENVTTSPQDTNQISPRIPSPVKSTSPIADIDAFLQRNKSRTISRQPNVDSSSHKTLFAEIDSLIQTYGQKRQMSPTCSDQQPDLDSAQIECDSRAQGQQLSVQADLPDVIMANSNAADIAATKIQSAYRGYRTRQQLKDEQQQQQRGVNKLEDKERENSSESDKTYTIDKRSTQDTISTPEEEEEVSFDEDSMKHKAATTIQASFRDYRKKRSISTEQNPSNDEQEVSKEHDTLILDLQKEKHEQNTSEHLKPEESVDHSNKIPVEEKDTLQDKTSIGDNLLENEDKTKPAEKSMEHSVNNSVALQHSQSVTSMVDLNHETLAEQEKSETLSNVKSMDLITHDNVEQQNVTDEKIKESSTNVHHQPADSLNLKHSPDLGQVHSLKITELEDKFLDQPVTGDSGTDARHEELKDISEITHDAAAIKIQSTYRGFKTRQSLKNNNQHSLDSIPEVMSPTNQEMNKEEEDDEMIEDGKSEHEETTEIGKNEHEDTTEDEKNEHEDTTEDEKNEHEDTIENGKNEHEDKNKENDDEHMTNHAHGTAVQAHLDSNDVDISPDVCRQNTRNHQDKSTDADAWRYQLLYDATTDEDSTAKDETSTGHQSDSTMYDSEPHGPSSPDGKIVQGYRSNQRETTHHQQAEDAGHQRAEESAGLQHSGEMHDTIDIFLSSEELSQGAEMLTSQDTKTNGGDDGAQRVIAHAQCSTAANRASYDCDHVHSVMETAKTQRNNNTSTTQHSEHQQQTVGADMGPGNDEALAATKIQAGFRGYQVRKQMKLKKNGSEDAKMVKRCSSGRRRSSIRRGDAPKGATDLEERSATKIQAGIRGFLVRKRQKSTKDKQ